MIGRLIDIVCIIILGGMSGMVVISVILIKTIVETIKRRNIDE